MTNFYLLGKLNRIDRDSLSRNYVIFIYPIYIQFIIYICIFGHDKNLDLKWSKKEKERERERERENDFIYNHSYN